MKKKKNKFLSIVTFLTFVLTFLFPLPNSVSAYVKEDSNTFKFPSNITLQGIFKDYSLPFHIEKTKTVTSGKAVINFSQSDIREYENSTLTLELNDTPIKTVKLKDYDINKGTIESELDPRLIKPEGNTFKVKIFHRITDEKCTYDEINSGNWLSIHKDSYLTLNYKEDSNNITLRNFPYPYVDKALENSSNFAVVIPDNSSKDELTASFRVLSTLSRMSLYSNKTPNLVRYKDIDEYKDLNLILVGIYDNIGDNIKALIESNEVSYLDNKALIKEATSPYNEKNRLLIITSKNIDSLLQGVASLDNGKIVSQFNDKYQVIENYTKPERDYPYTITFENSGYGDLELKGSKTHNFSYYISVPKDKKILNSSLITIKYKTSSLVKAENSSITLYINNVPIKDKKIYDEKSNEGEITVNIPKEFENNNSLDIKLAVYIDGPSLNCDIRELENAWVFISKDSFVELNLGDNKNVSLNNFQSSFIKNYEFNNVEIIVPDDATSKELTSVSTLVYLLGKEAKTNDSLMGNFAGNVSNKNGNKVLFGTPDRNPLIKDINSSLPIPYNESFKNLYRKNGVPVLDTPMNDYSVLELLTSPWGKENNILVFTSPSEGSLEKISSLILKENLINGFKENVAIIGKNKTILSLNPSDYSSNKPSSVKKLFKILSNNNRVLIVSMFILVSIILGAVFFIMNRKKK
ncbi:cellulose biosynthesis cyclic di-GMP-binding regulatory protein BcsB [Clostridium hydrogeniformans]|uniref:cellulose biosynthesis cyclic di-GMP-binding regulatory protein BcsB n=1 Tax=Clostridium hydrogeniformans TaxID=349933 RepID=UPI00048357A2|nr:cellulose biosynthesis cyclic di-GMP-binding regulatory protein BcsB [Clostridium hydrogeniformans]